ncbi:TetR/AcrR family transcriptional regulator [Marvinbryantia formatexigens]|nr:TetR-like C-terminal domain-containing protein [Marvinbryantia formatexigens]UWO25771.1 TetR family transcriptional regulator C-terminal domain-containing protein [Marvinbryantia formatexigens DSM 14469]SDF36497.1 transcriptional regulator, TetR family [Marvinbryantia formatexigens]
MSNLTKQALEDSLKRLLLRKPLDKITISDLTSDCGISRMTFYYHFKDIYDLVEWVCLEDATKALQGKKTYDTWQEGLLQIFEAVYENKPFILNVFRSISRDRIESYLFQLTCPLIAGVVEEKSAGASITEKQKTFIASFYAYSFIGVMLDWIKNGMKEDYPAIAENITTTIHGNITNSIRNYSQPDTGLSG